MKFLAKPPVGILYLEGKDCLDFIHRMSTNDMRGLNNGTGRTTIFTTEKGKIIDVVDVYCVDGGFYIIHSEGTRASLLDLFERYVIMEDVSISENKIFSTVLGLQGTSGKKDVFTDIDGTIVMSSPRIYLNGQLYVSDDRLSQNISLVKTGYSVEFKEYNALRLEQGIPLFEFDFDSNINPLEANFREYISWTKGCYVGQEVIARLDSYNKIKRFLKGVIINPRPAEYLNFRDLELTEIDSRTVYNDGAIAGTITSIGYSPNLNTLLLLVRFEKGNERSGIDVEFEINGVLLTGEIVDLPFVKGIQHE